MNLIKKYKSMSVQARAALWFVFCSFLQKGISFVTVPIFTRMMTTEEYGAFTLYLSWLQIFTVITSLYLYNGVFDNGMAKFAHDRDRYTASMQGLTVCLNTVVFLVVLLFIKPFEVLLGMTPVMIILMFAEMYVTPALAFWTGKKKFEYKYASVVAVTLAKSVLNPILGIAAIAVARDAVMARIVSVVVVELIFCGTVMILQFWRGKIFFHKEYWMYGVKLATPMLPHYLSTVILNQGDRVMIERMVGKTELALYGVAYNIGMLVKLFVSAINSAIIPWVYGKLKEGNIQPIRKRFSGLMILVALISLGLMLISPEVVLIFGSSEYANAVYIIPPVAASVFFVFLYGLTSYPEFYYEKTWFLMIASVAAALLNVLLNFFCIQWFGYVAAAYTTLFCYIAYGVGHHIIGGRILKAETGESSLIEVPLTVGISVALIVSCWLVSYTFDWFVVRYGVILAGVVAAFCCRKQIVGFLVNFDK